MGLPYSKNQIDKLGERLAAAASPSDEDLTMLEEVVLRHAAVVSSARARLDQLKNDSALGNVSITGRAKTSQTIIEKIRRNRTRLSSMEDLAGVRLAAAMTLSEQNRVADVISAIFAEGGPVRRVDRRDDPRAGYRAVHVIARLDGVGLEIQIRTALQDLWANIFEKAADYLGREIRYGGPPKPLPDLESARTAVSSLIDVSDVIYRLEQFSDAAPGADVSAAEHVLREILDAMTSIGS